MSRSKFNLSKFIQSKETHLGRPAKDTGSKISQSAEDDRNFPSHILRTAVELSNIVLIVKSTGDFGKTLNRSNGAHQNKRAPQDSGKSYQSEKMNQLRCLLHRDI
jgi:hypothetical protein